MAPCKVHGGCKHPDLVGSHRCCATCKELVHILCFQKANGVQDAPEQESGFTCGPAGSCGGAGAYPPLQRDSSEAGFNDPPGTCAAGAKCTRGRKGEALIGVTDCCGNNCHMLCARLPCVNCSSPTRNNAVAGGNGTREGVAQQQQQQQQQQPPSPGTATTNNKAFSERATPAALTRESSRDGNALQPEAVQVDGMVKAAVQDPMNELNNSSSEGSSSLLDPTRTFEESINEGKNKKAPVHEALLKEVPQENGAATSTVLKMAAVPQLAKTMAVMETATLEPKPASGVIIYGANDYFDAYPDDGKRSTGANSHANEEEASSSRRKRELLQAFIDGERDTSSSGDTSADDYNSSAYFPDDGKWSTGAKGHVDEEASMSSSQWEKLKAFIDGERPTSGDTRVALDILPPRVRPDTP